MPIIIDYDQMANQNFTLHVSHAKESAAGSSPRVHLLLLGRAARAATRTALMVALAARVAKKGG